MSGLIKKIDEYYTGKLREFGATPKGVDWNSDESQALRFEKLLSFIKPDVPAFSLLDYGCGFGSMFQHMTEKFASFNYTGFDISAAMIEEATKIFQRANAHWISVIVPGSLFDYVIASGVFNVKLQHSEAEWIEYMHQVIHEMNAVSTKGFAFNVLSKYSDEDKRKDYLHYANPNYWFDFCKKNYSAKVALLHDYPLYEFTLQVIK
ncbi:MAG: class I SAM-dependent methyltransferase [Bacteroidetes bacterium]|nr:class I SAM-dependent methyltransferase [Bacteroidota bacterium]